MQVLSSSPEIIKIRAKSFSENTNDILHTWDDWYFNYYVINWTHLSFSLFDNNSHVLRSSAFNLQAPCIMVSQQLEGETILIMIRVRQTHPINRPKVDDVPVEWTMYSFSVIGLHIFRANNTINPQRISGNEYKLHVKHEFSKQCIMTKNTAVHFCTRR